MKKVSMVLLFALVTIVSFGQDEEVIRDVKKFEDATTGLYVSKVIEVPSKSQKELQTQFKNWASTSFVNLREVMVSETDNQIVLNYITKTPNYVKTLGMKVPMDYDWYVRLVAQFKDGKIRVQFYDDGNVFKPGEYSRYGNVPATPARSMFIKAFSNHPKPENPKELHRASGLWYDMTCDWEEKIDNMVLSCEKGMKDNSLIVKSDF
jgi:hypothetical protein